MTAAAARVGPTRGITTDRTISICEQPSIRAASSMSIGTPSTAPFQNPGDHRDREGRVGEDEAGKRVEERELGEDRVKRHHQHGLGQHLGHEQGETEQALAPEAEARQCIGRKDRERDAQGRRSGRDDGAVCEPRRDRDRRKDLLVDTDLIERRQEAGPRREQIRRGRERRHEHPVDREGGAGEQREHREHAQGVLRP